MLSKKLNCGACICIPALCIVLVLFGAASPASLPHARILPRNVIVLITDGCSFEQLTFARWLKGEPLSCDPFLVGTVKTHTADSVIADSAGAASAFATGFLTSNGSISVSPEEEVLPGVPVPDPSSRQRPLATVLEGARIKGKATGVVVTARVSDATPAAYMAHVSSRSMEETIMEQAVHQNIDVILGGGRRNLGNAEWDGKRSDGEDLTAVLRQRGYQLPVTRDELMILKSGKVFGLFSDSQMEPEIDRRANAPQQPTLEEMTQKAIEILSKDEDGFFLMVEASQVDWACHSNDPAYLAGELLMFDRTFKMVLEYAKRDASTLVLALPDHNTGGFSIGNGNSRQCPERLSPATVEMVKRMKASSMALWRKVQEDKSPQRVRAVVKEEWGIDLSDEDAGKILSLGEKYKKYPNYAFGEVICPQYTCFGWTTHGHTAGDVPLYGFGPGCPRGALNGPEVGKATADALGLDLHQLTARLFVEADTALARSNVKIDKSDAMNPVLKVEYKGRIFELPVNKNILRTSETELQIEGVVVYSEAQDKAYIPLQAVHMIMGSSVELPSVDR